MSAATDVQRSPLIDPLTSLGTRQAMTAVLTAALAERRPGALCLIDLHGFRALRLRRGDDQANLVLQRIAQDLPGLGGQSFRLHEDHFAVVLPSAGDLTGWADHAVATLTRAAGGLTVSIGTARLAPALSAPTVEQRAHQALEAAKRAGGAHRDHSDVGTGLPAELTSAKAQALYDVLGEGYLRVNYQPIVDLRDGHTIGYEALARPQVDHGLEGPAEAFAVAGQLGLVAELDAVCRQSIFADGPGFDMLPGTRLHINLAPLSLGHRSLRSAVLRRQLSQAGLSPDRVVFELTEQDDATPGAALPELRRLAQRGFTLLLDDLGTGSGGLNRLKTGLFGELKIANDVIASAPTSTYALGVMEAVCAFARHTDALVIAEGLESVDLVHFVERFRLSGHPDWRIPAGQGYQLGKPTPQPRAAPR